MRLDMAHSSCQFCKTFNKSASLRTDIVLRERNDEHFIVIADASPIIFSHLLILPRDHVRAFAEIDPQLMPEFERIRKETYKSLKQIANHVICGEHGTAGTDLMTSACCEHAHYHMIGFHSSKLAKAVLDQYTAFSQSFSLLANPHDIIVFDGVSYVSFQLDNGETLVWPHDGFFPVQMLRGALNFSLDDKSKHCYRQTINSTSAAHLGALWPRLQAPGLAAGI
jgi:diadenosine tetraphosphate (Ap4A) HIT family hydrolase